MPVYDVFIIIMGHDVLLYIFFFNDTATTEIYTLSLHDALPIWPDFKRHLNHNLFYKLQRADQNQW